MQKCNTLIYFEKKMLKIRFLWLSDDIATMFIINNNNLKGVINYEQI